MGQTEIKISPNVKFSGQKSTINNHFPFQKGGHQKKKLVIGQQNSPFSMVTSATIKKKLGEAVAKKKKNNGFKTSTSWWLNHPSEKYARQIGFIFPKVWDEHQKKLSCHHQVYKSYFIWPTTSYYHPLIPSPPRSFFFLLSQGQPGIFNHPRGSWQTCGLPFGHPRFPFVDPSPWWLASARWAPGSVFGSLWVGAFGGNLMMMKFEIPIITTSVRKWIYVCVLYICRYVWHWWW